MANQWNMMERRIFEDAMVITASLSKEQTLEHLKLVLSRFAGNKSALIGQARAHKKAFSTLSTFSVKACDQFIEKMSRKKNQYELKLEQEIKKLKEQIEELKSNNVTTNIIPQNAALPKRVIPGSAVFFKAKTMEEKSKAKNGRTIPFVKLVQKQYGILGNIKDMSTDITGDALSRLDRIRKAELRGVTDPTELEQIFTADDPDNNNTTT